ncbi:MAG: prolipoprotein diacylglyceryl transferase [Dehalococcoidia bacterium]|nr:prolipoprotein diacylglyceryl transferase [Dehalococcoidia bacterium]MSQ35227.1 prolipoprotein diacylglyceryl transferase [Dehalococcoidia bacterium]
MTQLGLLSIRIPFNPNIISSGSFTLSWHGLLSFVGVAVAVYLIARWARKRDLDPDMVYNTAIWAILGGIVGARIVHVADNWDVYRHNPGDIFALWAGGIGLWGAILGGWAAGMIYARISRYPVGKLMDLAAPAMLIAQTIGRVGDIINGEHWSRATSLPWGWYFSHVDNPGRDGAQRFFGDPEKPVHPAVVYEMIWNMLVLAVIFRFRDRLKPDGSLWMVYLALYAAGRFMIQFVRLDSVKFWGLQEAHLIALLVLLVTVPFIVWKTRFKKPGENGGTPGPQGSTRTERRRKLRSAKI